MMSEELSSLRMGAHGTHSHFRTALYTTPKLPLEISPAISKSACDQAQTDVRDREARSRHMRTRLIAAAIFSILHAGREVTVSL